MGKIKIEGYLCERCLHKWRARNKEPRVCPRCKSAWWNVPKKLKNKNKKRGRNEK